MRGGTIGGYRLEDQIGRGGMGTVFRARDPAGRTVAVKVLTAADPRSPGRMRFLYEVSTLKAVENPHVVRILKAGVDGRRPWMAMEYLDVPDLEALIRRAGRAGQRLPMARVLAIGVGLFNAVAALGRAGVMHRDIKPANLLIRRDGRPVLVDFGLAMMEGEGERLTKTGRFVGTLDFLPPEQLSGAGAGPRTDVYSAALTLWYGLTGENPGGDDPPMKRALQRMFHGVEDIREHAPEVPEPVALALGEALHRDPTARPHPGDLAHTLALAAAALDAAAGGSGGAQPAPDSGPTG